MTVEVRTGRPVVVVDADQDLLALLGQVRAQLVNRQRPVPAALEQLVTDLARATRVAAIGNIASLAGDIGSSSDLTMNVSAVSRAFKIPTRTVTHRCRNGTYRARLIGGHWFIDPTSIDTQESA